MTETGQFLPPDPGARFATIRRPSSTAPDEAHGSRVQPRRRSVPRPNAARGWTPTFPARRCRAATRGRASPRISNGSARSSTRATRWCRGPKSTAGRDASPVGVADLRGGVLPRRRAAARDAERHLPARADDLRVRHGGAAGPHPPRRWHPARRPGARAGRSRTRAATSRASSRRRRATTRPAAGDSRVRRRGRRAARSARISSACSAAIPTAERHHGLTYFLVDLVDAGRDRPAGRATRRRRRLRRGVLRRRVRPRHRRARRTEPGLERRDGDHRLGARPHAAHPRAASSRPRSG